MQRFSRLTTHSHTTGACASTNINTKRTRHQNQKHGQRKWPALLLGAVIVTASASVPLAGNNAEGSLAAQGHAKRYMRINDYLFHGTQKTTAVAQHAESDHPLHV